jgi:hypothetical protein
MFVTFSTVEMSPETSEETAIRFLNDELLPQLKQAPGFVRGTWFGNGNKGHGAVVFETEEQAKGGLQEIGFELGGVKVTSSEVFRLHAEG